MLPDINGPDVDGDLLRKQAAQVSLPPMSTDAAPTITAAQRKALSAIGRLGGLSRSEKLTEARRINGAKGGRPNRAQVARMRAAFDAIGAAKSKAAKTAAYRRWLAVATKAEVRSRWTPALGPKPEWMDA